MPLETESNFPESERFVIQKEKIRMAVKSTKAKSIQRRKIPRNPSGRIAAITMKQRVRHGDGAFLPRRDSTRECLASAIGYDHELGGRCHRRDTFDCVQPVEAYITVIILNTLLGDVVPVHRGAAVSLLRIVELPRAPDGNGFLRGNARSAVSSLARMGGESCRKPARAAVFRFRCGRRSDAACAEIILDLPDPLRLVVAKIWLFPEPAKHGRIHQRAAVGPISGEVMILLGLRSTPFPDIIAPGNVTMTRATGEMLPRFGDESAPAIFRAGKTGGCARWLAPRQPPPTTAGAHHHRQSREVSNRILADLGRGVTAMQGKGMYTGADRSILMCALTVTEAHNLKTLLQRKTRKQL
jgi:hypothetical protein